MVLCAYLAGFEKMIRIVSHRTCHNRIHPDVGLATVIRGSGNLSHIRQYETVLVLGSESTGKSTLVRNLAHLASGVLIIAAVNQTEKLLL